jgi:hypothetical protein
VALPRQNQADAFCASSSVARLKRSYAPSSLSERKLANRH